MSVFQDILNDSCFADLQATPPVSLKVLQTELRPALLRLEIKYTPTAVQDILLELTLDRASEIEVLQPLIEQCGYQVNEIKGLVLSGAGKVRLYWRAKAETLQAFGPELLPFTGLESLWQVCDPQQQPVFSNLDQSYYFVKMAL